MEIASDRLYATTLARVEAQGKSVRTLSSEIQSLEGTLGKVIKPLVGSVKEIREAVKDIKKAKPKTAVKKLPRKK